MIRPPQIPDWREFSKRPEHFGKDIMEVKRLFLIEQSRFINDAITYQMMSNMSSGGPQSSTVGSELLYPNTLYVQQYNDGVPYLGVVEYTQDSTLNGKPTWSYTISIFKLTIEWNGANWQLHWRYTIDNPPNWSIGDTYLAGEQEVIVPGPSTDQPTGVGVYSLTLIADGSTASYDVSDSN